MEQFDSIYTLARECADCHKCIRECPVKSIRVQDGSAQVMPGLCIQCGNCVLTCPTNAKQVRDDLPAAKRFMQRVRTMVASVSPTFVSQYPGIHPSQLIAALKLLGFDVVSEETLGAEQVAASIRQLLENEHGRVWISSACPVVVDYIEKYRPEYNASLVPFLSPLLTHAKMLREQYGEDLGIVYIGPCIAKKKEADDNPDLLSVALTYEDLDRWMAEEKIDLDELAVNAALRFEPQGSREGALFPIEGGMAAGILGSYTADEQRFMAFSGFTNVVQALTDIQDWKPEQGLFLELNACAGSCINGPKAGRNRSIAQRRYEVMQYARRANHLHAKPRVNWIRTVIEDPIVTEQYTNLQLTEALRVVGKYTVADELNCGGCGYETCREFARALIPQKAERLMCTTFMRQLAQKKAVALLQRMPSAAVIVDENLNVIESNALFARLFSREEQSLSEFNGDAVNRSREIPFAYLFRRVLETGEDIVGHDIRYERRILTSSIFTIEPGSMVGGIFRDITEPSIQKEQIISRAREVIEKNMKTVQQIAYLLGENAADSEIILNSIVESFTPEDVDAADAEHKL